MGWKQQLAKAVLRGRFTRTDKRLAADWGTCAVGELPRRVTKVVFKSNQESSGPIDSTLDALGYEFMTAVQVDAIGDAVTIHQSIRARIKELRT